MPAPKKFNPAPTTSPSPTTTRSSDAAQGRYAVVPPVPKPREVDEESVEIDVDEVTVVMRNVSKYEPGMTIDLDDLDDLDEVPELVEPVPPVSMDFGEWRTESNLEGTHYHRKDSRRI